MIAGPNGSGKTTFARDYLSSTAGVAHLINADLIAGGLSPLDSRLAAVAAEPADFSGRPVRHPVSR